MTDESITERNTIEQLAESFVARFRAGDRPSIEEFVQRHPDVANELRELLPALVLLEQNASLDNTDAFGRKVAAVPHEIGDFAIVREIARGGMGVVYEAIQQSLGRHVALKVLASPGLLNPSHLERFQLEARAAARLHHTHIVPVFGVGEHEGMHYYAMQFIQGQSLDLVIDALRKLRRTSANDKPAYDSHDIMIQSVAEGLLTGQFNAAVDGASENTAATQQPTFASSEKTTHQANSHCPTELTSSHTGREFYHSVARVGLQVAEALAYAHSEGILHRDIKPSNLLLDAHGSVWVTDFGLAKAEGTDGLTRTGDFVGTLRYMAPERLEGWSDRRSDLYSLGATLYELLTLRPFLESDGRGQLVDKILHESPAPPSKIDRQIPRDLETIVLKAIGKEPASRYRTADEMAEDLQRFLADRPVLARRSTLTERFVRWCRRNPVVAALVMAVFALLTCGVTVSMYFAASASREAKLADASRSQAEQQGKRAETISKYFMDDVVGLADPQRSAQTGIQLIEAIDRAAGKIDSRFGDDPQLRAELRDRFGEIYCGVDQPQKAIEQLKEAVALHHTLSADGDPKTLASRASLGHALYLAGHFSESCAFLEPVWAEQTRILGPADPATLRTSARLCIALMEVRVAISNRERTENDVEISRKSYEAALAEYGARDPHTLEAENIYAWILRWRDDPSDTKTCELVLKLAQESADGLLKSKGPDDITTMFAEYNHGSALRDLNRNDEATSVFESLLEHRIHVLGITHVDTMFTVWCLAACLQCAGKNAESADVLERFHPHLADALAANNFRHARPIWNMSYVYERLGRIDRAAEYTNIVYKMLMDESNWQLDDSVHCAVDGPVGTGNDFFQ